MNPEPLLDLTARVLSVSVDTPAPIVIDRLLRLQNGEPITMYISPSEDRRSIGILDFLQLHAVIQSLRSPVHTVALGGMLRGYEVILLAAGKKGHRHILEHSFICLEPLAFDHLPFSDGIIGQTEGMSLRQQAEQLLRAEMRVILQSSQIDPAIFETSQIISGVAAITHGIVDRVVPINPTPNRHQTGEVAHVQADPAAP